MNTKKRLLEQEQALDSFFDALLRDVEAYAEQEDEFEPAMNQVEPAPLVADADKAEPALRPEITSPSSAKIHDLATHHVNTSPEKPKQETQLAEPKASPSIFERIPVVAPAPPEVKPAVKPVVKAPVVEKVKVEPVITAAAPPKPKLEPEPKPSVEVLGKPSWAEHEFQAMLFKVAGLTLAVPLMDLNGVIEWDSERITTMPGHAEFYLGLMTHLGKNIPLVDTAKLVLPPEKIRLLAGDDPLAHLTRIVLINDSAYGLACDDVNEVITLKPDDVRWRTSRTQRRWLAGTVVEHMCALIDASAFADLLKNRASVDAFRE